MLPGDKDSLYCFPSQLKRECFLPNSSRSRPKGSACTTMGHVPFLPPAAGMAHSEQLALVMSQPGSREWALPSGVESESTGVGLPT